MQRDSGARHVALVLSVVVFVVWLLFTLQWTLLWTFFGLSRGLGGGGTAGALFFIGLVHVAGILLGPVLAFRLSTLPRSIASLIGIALAVPVTSFAVPLAIGSLALGFGGQSS